MSYNLPSPSLVGIILAVSTHGGPQIVYSYPETLSTNALAGHETLDINASEESDEDIDDEDYELITNDGPEIAASAMDVNHPDYYLGTKLDLMAFLDARDAYRSRTSRLSRDHNAPHASSKNRQKSSPGSKNATATATRPSQILGFEPESLGDLLCPPREMCNRRFDVMLEKTVFLGLPIHVDSTGSWRTRSRHKHGQSIKSDVKDPSEKLQNPPVPPGSVGTRSPMSMFHLVFVMDPPDIERNYRVDDMFYNVISKLSLVLRYEQQKYDYVWSQVRNISALKDEWLASEGSSNDRSTLTKFLLSQSPLCKMMADCYEAISASHIANLNINNKLRSFQIPVKIEFRSLPEPTVPYIPGSYLSSNPMGPAGSVNVGETTRYNDSHMELLLGMADPYIDSSDDEDSDGYESDSASDDIAHLALLLWDDPEIIIRDIKADPDSTIAKFVRMVQPTESLSKTCQKLEKKGRDSQLDIADIKSFALHLVYWRRARIIPPLSTRAIYIVSPMAPMGTTFHRDIANFNQSFPTVPSLPSFLKLLSARSKKPRQFASIIPSRDHKDMYLLALAWLVRYGYVVQLHTYIWLKVSKRVKMKVEEEIEEEFGRMPKMNRAKTSSLKDSASVDNKVRSAVDNSSKQIRAGDKAPAQSSSSSIDDEIDRLQKRFEVSNSIPDLVLEDDGDTILVDPGRASTLERRWINKIIHDECSLSAELTVIFYKVLKYMNGKNSLELLLLRENVSRTEMRKLLLAIEDHIISVRHW